MEAVSVSHTICMNTECLSATCISFCILEKIIRDVLCFCHIDPSPVASSFASPSSFYTRVYVV